MSIPIVERLRDHVQYSYVPAECRRSMDEAADLIEALVEAANNLNLTFDSYGKERLPEYVRKEFAPLLKALARARGEA